MFRFTRSLIPLDDRGPLRVMFVATSLPVGGAETLLVELVRRMDRARFAPELCCLKQLGPLGEVLEHEVPTFWGLLAHKYDLRVLPRLTHLLVRRRIDAVITVGTGGDRMFWGRLAGLAAGVPVLCSAIHSTGVPSRVEWVNRLLTPWTDAFIAVAEAHARFLVEHEGCPAHKTRVIPNGVDTRRFRLRPPSADLARALDITPGTPVAPRKEPRAFLACGGSGSRTGPGCRVLGDRRRATAG